MKALVTKNIQAAKMDLIFDNLATDSSSRSVGLYDTTKCHLLSPFFFSRGSGDISLCFSDLRSQESTTRIYKIYYSMQKLK